MSRGLITDLAYRCLELMADGYLGVSVSGPVGAGKTTVCLGIVEELRRMGIATDFVPEERPEEAFDIYIKDPLTNALPFQMMQCGLRQGALMKAVFRIQAGASRFAVLERSIYEDGEFYSGNERAGWIPKDMRPIYEQSRQWVWDYGKGKIAIIWVQTTYGKTVHRIRSRDRGGEVDRYLKEGAAEEMVDGDNSYLGQIYNRYPAWADEMRAEGFPVIEVRNELHDDRLVRSSEMLDRATLRVSTPSLSPLAVSSDGSRSPTPAEEAAAVTPV